MSEGFDWRGDGDVVAVPPQRAVAVYRNGDGELVIRQQSDWGDEEDAVIIISPENVPKLLAAITRETTPKPLALPAPKRSRATRTLNSESPVLPFVVD